MFDGGWDNRMGTDSYPYAGLKIVKPNEARVLTLFGKYYGTIKEPGFYYVNPFCTSFSPTYNALKSEAARKAAEAEQQGRVYVATVNAGKAISLKTQAFDNRRQKVNDVLGNPIIIGAVVIWRVADPTKAVFAVENYSEFLSIQADSTVRILQDCIHMIHSTMRGTRVQVKRLSAAVP